MARMRAGERRRARRRAGDIDAGALSLHHPIEDFGVARRKANASVRGRAAEVGHRIGAVDGVAAGEEDRIGHRRHVVLVRIMHSLQMSHVIVAAGRRITRARSGDGPVISGAIAADMHGLRGEIDVDLDPRFSRFDAKQAAQKNTDADESSHRAIPPGCWPIQRSNSRTSPAYGNAKLSIKVREIRIGSHIL